MRNWISERQEKSITVEEHMILHVLCHEIEVDPLGISCCFFTFSYQFLGRVRFIQLLIYLKAVPKLNLSLLT